MTTSKTATSTTEKISLRETISYGIGDLACSMVFNFMASYLLYFYTDVAGITVAAAGTIMSTARLIDAFANPVVGVLSDRTHTRWGKLRPYLLFSAVPLALSVVAIFLASRIPQGGQIAYALVTYTLFCLLYTVCNVPYTAMMANLTEDPAQRAKLNMSKFICVSIGTFLSMGLALPLINLFGGGDEKKGFTGLSILFALIIASFVLTCFANTKERIQSKPMAFSIKTMISTIKKSKPWVLYCISQLFFYLATVTRNSATLYYAKYYLGEAGFASLLLAVGAFTTFATAFIVPVLTARVKKRTFTLFGYGLFAVSCLLVYFAGSNLVLIFIFNLLANLGASLANGVSFLILGETIDHSEYTTGSRQQGLLTSMSMFMVKIGVVISSVISAFVLNFGGYVPDHEQAASALMSIKINYIFLPCVSALVCVCMYIFYKLDNEYPFINAALKEKHSKAEE